MARKLRKRSGRYIVKDKLRLRRYKAFRLQFLGKKSTSFQPQKERDLKTVVASSKIFAANNNNPYKVRVFGTQSAKSSGREGNIVKK
ncbi:hypothetical protein KIN20_002782 [Parelaphostrongylus tenuis]|uniref:Uncharacterized protein n=1 Tax=Parelaphostrongylus tenuis TaxID=148309 RepID=A0AAD5MH58_PARTN|nr:hypothetical protein KIN20_002782 [Parelaphostrongylus tenuis]